jgi:predicted alpha/beta hydrolase family esterase
MCQRSLGYSEVAIIHGIAGSGATHWQRWLERKSRFLGAETVFPKMPGRFGVPDLNAWLGAWQRLMPLVGETAALVGHSLGCATILQRLARDEGIRTVGLVILVAPGSVSRIKESAAIRSEAVRKGILGFYEEPGQAVPLHVAAARKAKRVAVFTSDNDPLVNPMAAFDMALEMNATFHMLHGKGHFNVAAGFHRFPEVLELLAAP